MSDEVYPINKWIKDKADKYLEEEAKSTIRRDEREHLWNQFKQLEINLQRVVLLRSIVQNPMLLTKEDANKFAEEVSRAQEKLMDVVEFLESVSKFIDSKLI